MLRPQSVDPVTEETARVAFPRGHAYLRLTDELGALFTDEPFVRLYPMDGQPAAARGAWRW